MVGCTLMTHGLDRDLHPIARVEAALPEGEGGYAECGTMRSEPAWIVKLTMEKQYIDLKSPWSRGYRMVFKRDITWRKQEDFWVR